MIEFWLNDHHIRTSLPAGLSLLDFIRYEHGLKGTKVGCREGDCGAVLLEGSPAPINVQEECVTSVCI